MISVARSVRFGNEALHKGFWYLECVDTVFAVVLERRGLRDMVGSFVNRDLVGVVYVLHYRDFWQRPLSCVVDCLWTQSAHIPSFYSFILVF